MARFAFFTIATRMDEFEAMRASFRAAGFDEGRATFEVLDNTAGNRHDPREVANVLVPASGADYAVFCHQDVRADCGTGYEQLADALAGLTSRDPTWAVAGNAGVTPHGRQVAHLTAPWGLMRSGDLPEVVRSLDENFLVIRPDGGVGISPGFDHFHLYATDLCLNAARRGRRCHVIDFHIRHLSAGTPDSPQFAAAAAAMADVWRPQFHSAVIDTLCTRLAFSRIRLIDRLLRTPRGRKWANRLRLGFVPRPVGPAPAH